MIAGVGRESRSFRLERRRVRLRPQLFPWGGQRAPGRSGRSVPRASQTLWPQSRPCSTAAQKRRLPQNADLAASACEVILAYLHYAYVNYRMPNYRMPSAQDELSRRDPIQTRDEILAPI